MNIKIAFCIICFSTTSSFALSAEQVLRCTIEIKAEVDNVQGAKQLDPEGSYDLFKLFYENDELIRVEKMPRQSRCKDGPNVQIGSDLIEIVCKSTLFKDFTSYYVVNRFTGEYRSEHVSSDGKLIQRGTCRLVKPHF